MSSQTVALVMESSAARAAIWIILVAFNIAAFAASDAQVASLAERRVTDRLLTVDCLLPSQVRQLGPAITYMTPRRPVKTTAGDCEVRGGEYVAYDRANYETALRVWQGAADQGDKEAQTNVGEIYERGLGGAPDYAKAAEWYRKAADQGYARALIDLGFLYELGRGVPPDPAAALQLYRRAAGLTGTVTLASPATGVSQEEIDKLRKELERTRQELDKARRDLDQQRLKSSSDMESLIQQKIAAASAGNTEETRRLETLLRSRESELENRRQQVAQFEKSAEENRLRLSRLEGDGAAMRQQLADALGQLKQNERDIESKKGAAEQAERALKAAHRALAQEMEAGPRADPAQLRALEEQLAKRNSDYDLQKLQLAQLKSDVDAYKAKVAKFEAKPATTSAVDIEPPTIQILDPPVVVTRDAASVKITAGVKTRDVHGKVAAPAGLSSFTANDVAQSVDDRGFFTKTVALVDGKNRVSMVAIDRQGKRAVLEFFLESEASAKLSAPSPPAAPDLNLGKFHALLIGNQRYRSLRQLNSPEADVAEIGKLLQERYGFAVKILLNASRHDILTAMLSYLQTLTERDNLMIYYAGHGEIDPADDSASWLPIDADAGNNSNWISSDDLRRKLDPMRAKHILVVSDSCFSGVLTRSSMSQAGSGVTEEQRIEWLKSMAAKRSRTLLSSGGRAPVMDGGGGKHSVFASAFIEVLSVNDDLLDGRKLGSEVSMRVDARSKLMKFGDGQTPDYLPIKGAGYEGGDFLFPRPTSGSGRASIDLPTMAATNRGPVVAR